MATTVFRYPFPPYTGDVFKLLLPEGAEVLYVACQGAQHCVWARVNPKAPPRPRAFRWAGTGHPLAGDVGRYVGSWQEKSGLLVFHLFEINEMATWFEAESS